MEGENSSEKIRTSKHGDGLLDELWSRLSTDLLQPSRKVLTSLELGLAVAGSLGAPRLWLLHLLGEPGLINLDASDLDDEVEGLEVCEQGEELSDATMAILLPHVGSGDVAHALEWTNDPVALSAMLCRLPVERHALDAF